MEEQVAGRDAVIELAQGIASRVRKIRLHDDVESGAAQNITQRGRQGFVLVVGDGNEDLGHGRFPPSSLSDLAAPSDQRERSIEETPAAGPSAPRRPRRLRALPCGANSRAVR